MSSCVITYRSPAISASVQWTYSDCHTLEEILIVPFLVLELEVGKSQGNQEVLSHHL